MNIRRLMLCSLFSLGLNAGLGNNLSAQEISTEQDSSLSQKPTEDSECKDAGFESIRLYYLRSSEAIAEIKDKINQELLSKTSGINDCSKGTVVYVENENKIVLYGSKTLREKLKRLFAILDLPREGVSMEMWGIRISSDNPEQLAEAMREVNREIDRTQQLLQSTYKQLENFARNIEIEPEFEELFETELEYQTALNDSAPSLSMVDILLRMNAASNPIYNYNAANKNLYCLFEEEDEADEKDREEKPVIPFENYRRIGLHQDQLNQDKNWSPTDCKEKNGDEKEQEDICLKNSTKKQKEVCIENLRIRGAVLDFALQYSHLIQKPNEFIPESLQKSADNLESILHPIVDAINRDVQELFIEPTLAKIQDIVREYDDVEYAEVGKTTVAGLNGVESSVSSTSVSAFNETPPLRLNELLDSAGVSADAFLPDAATNAIPAASVAKLITALGEDRSTWQQLTSGVTLKITPSVLRNSASAELEVDLTVGPGEAGTRQEGENIRPLSRISQNTVETSVYVNTLDIFALSTFNSQTTIDGGRTYIPIVGTIWEGVFSGIPVFGDLFSWQNAPKNVQHQSIVLTNSFIVPTAMGLAPLYSQESNSQEPINPGNKDSYNFKCLSNEIEKYINRRRQEITSEDLSEDDYSHAVCTDDASANR